MLVLCPVLPTVLKNKTVMPAAEGATVLDRIKWNGKLPSPLPKSKMKPSKSQNAPFSRPWFGGERGWGEGINLSKTVVEVIEEKSLRQYIIFITIVPLFEIYPSLQAVAKITKNWRNRSFS